MSAPPRVVRFIATDGSVEVDGALACKKSELVRDLCDMDESGDLEMTVPFDRETCDFVVAAWLKTDETKTKRVRNDYEHALSFEYTARNMDKYDAKIRKAEARKRLRAAASEKE